MVSNSHVTIIGYGTFVMYQLQYNTQYAYYFKVLQHYRLLYRMSHLTFKPKISLFFLMIRENVQGKIYLFQGGNYCDGEDFFSRSYFPNFQGHRLFFNGMPYFYSCNAIANKKSNSTMYNMLTCKPFGQINLDTD